MKNIFFSRLALLLSSGLLLLLIGCGDTYYDMNDFRSVDKIDAHVHINVDDSPMIIQAREDNIRLVTVNVGSDEISIYDQKEVALRIRENHSDRVDFLSALPLDHWDNRDAWVQNAMKHVRESRENGAVGIKVWKVIGMELRDEDGSFVQIDDPRFYPIFEYMTEHQMPLMGHIGEPKNCWLPLEEMTVNNDRDYFENHPEFHMYLHDDYPSYEEIIEARNNFLGKFPDLPFFGAHLGSMEWSIDMMAEHLDKYPNMVMGMAHRVPHLQYLAQQDRDKLRDFFITYQDRLLYSTDLMHYVNDDPEAVRELSYTTWRDDWEFFVTDNSMEVWQVDGTFRGLKLPKSVIDKIFRENAIAFFGL
ncbi:amidohydrolase family protein [Balneolales bacterium ANBcel1]|nr:amidohydrolase family protein [Balneolales bacterium ANBcel1]